MTSKDLLEYVLAYFGLDDANYINRAHPLGTVSSDAVIVFPHLKNFKYGGKIAIAGQGYNSAEAEEEAAYQSLLFIEKNFRTHVIDYNYTSRKKSTKSQNKLLSILESTIPLGDSVKMMFGELINAIEAKRRQFSFDPSTLFYGPMAPGQVDAYQQCAAALKDLHEHSVKCYVICEPKFDLLQKLSWVLAATKTNLPM